MSYHVHRLATAYATGQLSRRQRDRVLLHANRCPECRTVLDREQDLSRHLAAIMPLTGQPTQVQLARMWPAIMNQVGNIGEAGDGRSAGPHSSRWLPSSGLVVIVVMFCAFITSALLAGPTQVIAAPFQAAPTEILATATLVRTDEPAATAEASETISAKTIPMPSPAPVAGLAMVHVYYGLGK